MGGFNPFCNSKVNKLKKSGGAGYTETVKTEILPLSEIDANRQNNYGYHAARTSLTPALVAEKSYTVIFDGKTYNRKICKLSGAQPALGNLAHVGGEDSGEPWSVGLTTSGTANITAETAGIHTIAIYEETEIVNKIDPKFIPGAVLLVVELSITLEATAGATAELSAEDIAKLDAAAEQNCPCVLQFVFGQMEVVATAHRIGMGEAFTSFYVDIGQAKAQFVKQGGTWTAMVAEVAE